MFFCKKCVLTPCSVPCCTQAAAAKGVSVSTTWLSTVALSWLTSTATVKRTQSSTTLPNMVSFKLSVQRHSNMCEWESVENHSLLPSTRSFPSSRFCSTADVFVSSCSAAFRGILNNPTKAVRDTLVNQCAQILACYRKNCASPSSAGQVLKHIYSPHPPTLNQFCKSFLQE